MADIEKAGRKTDPELVSALNEVLTAELTAISQYFVHAKMCKDWGFERLHKRIRHESIDEMKHADRLIERILFLDGLPNLQNLGKLRIGENPEEVLRCDLALEMQAIPDLRAGIAHCETVQDYVTRDLFEAILKSEEDHVDWLETQLGLIGRLGAVPYLQTKVDE
jgi:bacterioferritin